VKFSQFMAGVSGRVLRFVAGAVLIFIGIKMSSVGGYVLALIGAVPFLASVFDVCVFAPLFHMPFTGKAIRSYKP